MSKQEQIRASIANMSESLVKDALSIILSKESSQPAPIKNEINSNYKNFAQAILSLKNKYKFPELDYFSVEADLVYVNAGDRRVLLTDRNVVPQAPNPHADQQDFDSEKADDAEDKDSIENAFEPIKTSENRFSHLEF